MITDNDLDIFFSDDFTQDATYTPQGGQASTIKIIFDNKYFLIPEYLIFLINFSENIVFNKMKGIVISKNFIIVSKLLRVSK